VSVFGSGDRLTSPQASDSQPHELPEIRFHPTARPWEPVDAPKDVLLDHLDAAVHALAPLPHWNDRDPGDALNGAIIDPYTRDEVQYATPLFAFNVATLLAHGRAADLVTPGLRALDRAARDISTGQANDHHGEFFAAPMVKALRTFEAPRARHPEITAETIEAWRRRLRAPRTLFMNLKVKQNWRAFAMRGEWLRQREGFITDGVDWIESCWLDRDQGHQRERFRRDLDRYELDPHFFLDRDDSADPETADRPVEATIAGRRHRLAPFTPLEIGREEP
jgi:hypothetical protein